MWTPPPLVTFGLTVVVTTNSLLGQWQDELKKFAPGLKVGTFHAMAHGAGPDYKEAALRQLGVPAGLPAERHGGDRGGSAAVWRGVLHAIGVARGLGAAGERAGRAHVDEVATALPFGTRCLWRQVRLVLQPVPRRTPPGEPLPLNHVRLP